MRDAGSSDVRIENVSWIPLVNHTVSAKDATEDAEAVAETHAVYALRDYTPELAAAHDFLGQLDDPVAWLAQKSAEAVHATGSNFPIDDGADAAADSPTSADSETAPTIDSE